jgi:hypothetical protein
VLRCIFGAKQENGTWRKRYNYELYEMFKDSDIVVYIKAKRLAWAGHLTRMSDDRTLKKIFSTRRMEPEVSEDRNCDGKMVLLKTCKFQGSREGRMSPSTETNGQNFLRRPGSTKDCRADDDEKTRVLWDTLYRP